MHWNTAIRTKNDLVVLLIVTDVANDTTSVLLRNLSSLVQTKLLDTKLNFLLLELLLGSEVTFFSFVLQLFKDIHLVKDCAVLHVIFTQLEPFNFLQEVSLQLARVV